MSQSIPIEGGPFPRAHTKIVATIGPASEDRIDELIEAGMSVARLNFSHGAHEDFRRRLEKVRRAADASMSAVGVLADIQGPKLRVSRFEGGERALAKGQRVLLREGAGQAAPGEVLIDFPGFLESVRTGHRVLLADGQVLLSVEDLGPDGAVALVKRAGVVGDKKGVHLPDTALRLDLPSERDKADIALARELGVDMIGVSFVSKPEEVRAIRRLAPETLIIGKVERMAALENLKGLLAECDWLMVARGDLGVEAELEELPMIQKAILQAAVQAGKFTITATEMLESMIEHSRPTRAEVNDVANAVLDGTDAVMLSAETAVGRYPVEAVATMTRIGRAVERSQRYQDVKIAPFRREEPDFSNATALAAVQAVEALSIRKIVCFTETGNTVRLISRYRPHAEIVALSPNPRTVNAMTVLAHVRPLLFRREPSLEDMLHMASEMLVVRGMAQYGDEIVFVAGVPPGVSRSTNVMKLHRVGEEIKLH